MARFVSTANITRIASIPNQEPEILRTFTLLNLFDFENVKIHK